MATQQLLATDRLLSPLMALGASGRSRAAYTPYGYRPTQDTAPSLGFTGQLPERALGWYLLGNGHRAYNPVLMRFHSADRLSPFGAGGINAYAYCKGDPINYHDPRGRYPTWRQLSTTTPIPDLPEIPSVTYRDGGALLAGTFGGRFDKAIHTAYKLNELRKLINKAKSSGVNAEALPDISVPRELMKIGAAGGVNALTLATSSIGAFQRGESDVFATVNAVLGVVGYWANFMLSKKDDFYAVQSYKLSQALEQHAQANGANGFAVEMSPVDAVRRSDSDISNTSYFDAVSQSGSGM